MVIYLEKNSKISIPEGIIKQFDLNEGDLLECYNSGTEICLKPIKSSETHTPTVSLKTEKGAFFPLRFIGKITYMLFR